MLCLSVCLSQEMIGTFFEGREGDSVGAIAIGDEVQGEGSVGGGLDGDGKRAGLPQPPLHAPGIDCELGGRVHEDPCKRYQRLGERVSKSQSFLRTQDSIDCNTHTQDTKDATATTANSFQSLAVVGQPDEPTENESSSIRTHLTSPQSSLIRDVHGLQVQASSLSRHLPHVPTTDRRVSRDRRGRGNWMDWGKIAVAQPRRVPSHFSG